MTHDDRLKSTMLPAEEGTHLLAFETLLGDKALHVSMGQTLDDDDDTRLGGEVERCVVRAAAKGQSEFSLYLVRLNAADPVGESVLQACEMADDGDMVFIACADPESYREAFAVLNIDGGRSPRRLH